MKSTGAPTQLSDPATQIDAHRNNWPRTIALGNPVPGRVMGGIARKLQIDHCKWDTQVGDTCVLSSQPFLIAETEWQWLCRKAEQATAELFAFEDEIAASPLLQRTIGIPWQLRDLFHAVGDECGPRK